MDQTTITPEMKVADVIHRYPQTFDVFRAHGCPDMRKGIFALSARIMKIRWAAKIHKIPVDELMQELNASLH